MQKRAEFGNSISPPRLDGANLSKEEPATSAETATELAGFYAALVQNKGERWALGSSEPEERGQGGLLTECPPSQSTDAVVVEPPGQNYGRPAGPPTVEEVRRGAKNAEIVLPESNIGYQLLKKAGWREGTGLGAEEQGPQEPLQVHKLQGNQGLGFGVPKTKVSRSRASQEQGNEAGSASDRHNKPGQSNKRQLRDLPPDPLDSEDIDTKVKRVRQVMQTEVDDKAGKEIARFVYSALGETAGTSTQDVNPLLKRNHRLSRSNPLL